jgi:hypothetical protein
LNKHRKNQPYPQNAKRPAQHHIKTINFIDPVLLVSCNRGQVDALHAIDGDPFLQQLQYLIVGLPFSPLSLSVSIARAARVRCGPEFFHSIADDAARRMKRTLPDTRRDFALH